VDKQAMQASQNVLSVYPVSIRGACTPTAHRDRDMLMPEMGALILT